MEDLLRVHSHGYWQGSVLTGCWTEPSGPCYIPEPLPGQLRTWQLAFLGASGQDGSHSLFVTQSQRQHFHCLFVRNESVSLVSTHCKGWRTTQRHGLQRQGPSGAIMEATYHSDFTHHAKKRVGEKSAHLSVHTDALAAYFQIPRFECSERWEPSLIKYYEMSKWERILDHL